MPDEAENKRHEDAFEESVKDDSKRWEGVIIYSVQQDSFMFMPLEGFPTCEPLASLSKADLSNREMSRSDRVTPFTLLLPGEEEGENAYIFLRVEEGNEIENSDAVANYLNHEMKSSPMVDRVAKYKQMVWSHRDALFKDFKYMTRSARAPMWQWEDRTVRGVEIRYEHEVVTNGAHRRVRPRRPDSVISSMSHAGSISVADPQDFVAPDAGAAAKEPKAKGQTSDETGTKQPEETPEVPEEQAPEVEAPEADVGDKDTGEKEATPESEVVPPSPPAPTNVEANVQAEVQEEVDPEQVEPDDEDDSDKYAVTDNEIKAELKNVKVTVPIHPKLMALYKELPTRADYIEPEIDLEKFRDMAARLRPFINAYLIATKQHRLGPLSVKKEWSHHLVQKENKRLHDYLDDRDAHEKEIADKKWEAAKKKAETKKRNSVNARERREKKKEAEAAKKAAAKAEKAAAAEAAKAKKAKEAEEAKAKKAKEAEDAKAKKAKEDKAAKAKKDAAEKKQTETDPEDEAIFADDDVQPSTSGTQQPVVPETQEPAADDAASQASVQTDTDTEDNYVPSVAALSREEILRQHGTRSHLNTEHAEIPPSASSRRTSRASSVEQDPVYLVTQAIRALNTTVTSIAEEQKKQHETANTNMKKVGDAMVLMAKNMDSMKMRLMKKDMENELIVCEAEGRINQVFPLAKLDNAADLLFTNNRTGKVVAEFICSAIELKNYANLNISKIVIRAAEVIFNAKLRAFMCMAEQRDTEEAQRGWDREPVPQGFIDIMEKYVFKHFPNAKSTPPSSPLVAQRPWKTVLAGHFSGRREAYFSWLAKDQDNCYEMVVERYAKKLEMHQLHHDPDEQRRIVKVPTLQQELAWYADSVNTSVEGLKTTSIKNKRANYKVEYGADFDIDFVKEMINTLTSLHYGVPAFATEFLETSETDAPVEGEEIQAAFEAAKLQRRGLDKYGLSRDDTVHADDIDSEEEDGDEQPGESDRDDTRKRPAGEDDDDDGGKGGKASPKKRTRTSGRRKD